MNTCSYQMYKDYIRTVAESRIPVLPFDTDMTCEMICGEEVWEQLSPGEQKLAGKCMKELVVENLLPLEPVKTVHEYPLKYRRREHL